ncbi:hypothetical protein Ait01nite_043530 [Actinoplanes italicus]|uniref:DUF1963 domain-containing protein n=1 Tax=Actinoplanes italicus TaxID=113567 RepID=A0A2T0KCM8_9ACTN|nr:hypothetical protein [Actinoplanes italicus]PRX20833.1 hypothetical protein CLV67_107110 [Actinoplanes italicus]GIE31308.1 hypothetical protein Ait01nite_043530 [Actinoplanes italicus]
MRDGEWWQGLNRADSAVGPAEAWLRPRAALRWEPVDKPIVEPVTKLGGQPVWLDEPFWPVSSTGGGPMVFIAQFRLPGPELRMAYLFIADDPDGTGLTFEPEGGDNALLVQPDGRIPEFVRGVAQPTGPSLWRRGEQWTERVPVEVRVSATDFGPDDEYHYSWIGGRPHFWQPDVLGIGKGWLFFFQLDGAEGIDEDAYALNFGGGTGFAFLSRDEREGRFFWDCV